MAQLNRGRVSDPAQAALSGSHRKAPGSAGGYLLAATEEALFEIDMELDELLEEIQGQVKSQGEPSEDLVARARQFCEAHGEKIDRIGRFVRMMGAREQFCRSD